MMNFAEVNPFSKEGEFNVYMRVVYNKDDHSQDEWKLLGSKKGIKDKIKDEFYEKNRKFILDVVDKNDPDYKFKLLSRSDIRLLPKLV